MKRILYTAFLLFCQYAQADWAVIGVAVKCDSNENKFELLSTMKSSYPDGNVPVPQNFTEISEGAYQAVNCTLGDASIKGGYSCLWASGKRNGAGAWCNYD